MSTASRGRWSGTDERPRAERLHPLGVLPVLEHRPEGPGGEVRIELPVDVHLPHTYIPSERLRLEMYRRLAEVRSDADVDQIRDELDDRYGEPPAEVASLLLLVAGPAIWFLVQQLR